jgi:MoxR-like ATPase
MLKGLDTMMDSQTLSITAALGVQGWTHLDPILLAALATESPLLLIGPHGTAKSLLIERVAQALQTEMRHYNASLINYDDLVGIPLPEEDGQHLRFVTTPGSIWDAQFVFFDEISRCRPDLQNKMFPIIHERRVIGIPLENLRHRWAAMNPPAPEDPDINAPASTTYFGSEPLDPALCDRFPFVIPVPDWKQLTKEDRRRLVAYHPGGVNGVDIIDVGLTEMVQATHELIPRVADEYGEWLTDYVVCVVDLLEQGKLPQSPRRARMLTHSMIAVHAARMILYGSEVDFQDSAEISLLFGLPQNATEVPPTPATVVAAHRQAWEIASRIEDDNWRQVLEERDAVRRVLLADELGFNDDDLSKLITQALGAQEDEARRDGLAVAMFFAFRTRRTLTATAWEPLTQLAGKVLEPRPMAANVQNNSTEMNVWNEIKDWLGQRTDREGMLPWLERNFVLHGFPELWRRINWHDALAAFRADLASFGYEETKS